MKQAKLSTMAEWLEWISSLNNKQIDLGLDRVKTLVERLAIISPTIVTVGGTNGKGSTVAILEGVYQRQGYRTGVFTSPVLFKHNEQVRLNGHSAVDEEFIEAFAKVETARGNVPLTSFEFHTLAAFVILQRHNLDIWILEVGLGGRLDAVNVLDADVSIVTSISLDHTDWLGETREEIGFEKAGIFRASRPAICGDPNPPNSLINAAHERQARYYQQGRDFYYEEAGLLWNWHSKQFHCFDLPKPSLLLQNASTALMGINLLQAKLPVTELAVKRALHEVKLAGRQQVIQSHCVEIYDVAHNPASVALLAQKLAQLKTKGKVFAVFSMLRDKDIGESIKIIANQIDQWHIAQLTTPRAASIQEMQAIFKKMQIQNVMEYHSVKEALINVRNRIKPEDYIVIFGSFHTLSESGSELL